MFAQVVFSRSSAFLDKAYTYCLPEELAKTACVGMQVLVPFGKRKAVGYIVSLSQEAPEGIRNLKAVEELRGDGPVFTADSLKTAKWISDHYVSFFGTAVKTILPPGSSASESVRTRKTGAKKAAAPREQEPSALPAAEELNGEQKNALSIITACLSGNKASAILVRGHSGSGKLKIYLETIKEARRRGAGAIMLFPEISHDSRLVAIFREKFGPELAVLHSTMTDRARLAEWNRIKDGKARIVLGTRSALFAPAKDLGVVLIDREEEFTYKQEQSPKYHARDAALFLSRIKGIPLVLGSGCPTVETYYKAKTGEFKLCELSSSRLSGSFPTVETVDMRADEKVGSGLLSRKLKDELQSALDGKRRAILVMNRRGYSPFLSCMECGRPIECPHCSVSLSYHTFDKMLHCHRCGMSRQVPLACPGCLSTLVRFSGAGTQKIEAEIAQFFPKAKTIRLDRDSVTGKSGRDIALKVFEEGGADILIGTQMALKAMEETQVCLVGIVSADGALNTPDYRSGESTMQLILDTCGVSRRHNFPGKVIVQTYNAAHYAVVCAAKFDYPSFYEKEVSSRKESGYPPFSKLISVVIYGRNGSAAKSEAVRIFEKVSAAAAKFDAVKVLGPVQTHLSKIKGMSRWQLLIKGPDLDIIKDDLRRAIYDVSSRDVRISIDVDPISIL